MLMFVLPVRPLLQGLTDQSLSNPSPVGVVIYVLVGGMRSSLLADYIHTTALFVIVLYTMFSVYTNKELDLGSPSKVCVPPCASSEKQY